MATPREPARPTGEVPTGLVRNLGLFGALEIVKNKETGERFSPGGHAGVVTRQASLNNGLVMRATGDSMIIAPPLVCSTAELDILVDRARAALDEALQTLREDPAHW